MNSLKTITLDEQNNYRLMEIGKIKDYFDQEIRHEQSLTSKLSKYLTCLDYAGKILTVFLTVFSGTNMFAHVKGKYRKTSCLIISVFSLVSALLSGLMVKLHEKTKTSKKKHNELLYLAKNKLDCVEILLSQTIEDQIITHNEFKMILNEKKTV